PTCGSRLSGGHRHGRIARRQDSDEIHARALGEEMTVPQAGFERRIYGALDAAPSRIPVILGGCGPGRTWLLQRVRDRAGRQAAQYIDVERSATTPERFLQAVISSSPFAWHGADRTPVNARDAFDAL